MRLICVVTLAFAGACSQHGDEAAKGTMSAVRSIIPSSATADLSCSAPTTVDAVRAAANKDMRKMVEVAGANDVTVSMATSVAMQQRIKLHPEDTVGTTPAAMLRQTEDSVRRSIVATSDSLADQFSFTFANFVTLTKQLDPPALECQADMTSRGPGQPEHTESAKYTVRLTDDGKLNIDLGWFKD